MIFFIRYIGALVYDLLIVATLLFVTTAVIILLNKRQTIQPATLWYQFTLVTVGFFYYYCSIHMGGQTLGMKAWHFKLVHRYDKKIWHWQIFARLIYFLPALIIAPFFLTGNYALLNRWTNTKFIVY